MSNLLKHLKTINKHRWIVCKWCFKLGIPLQGLVHDLSKYSPKELAIYKYYTGTRSPHDNARDKLGYSPSWYHHKNKNKHHWEYWVDSLEKMNAVKIPFKYVVEMVADFIAAGQTYLGKDWTCHSPIDYHFKNRKKRVFHPKSLFLFELLLFKLDVLGEKQFIKWFRQNKKQLKINYMEEN